MVEGFYWRECTSDATEVNLEPSQTSTMEHFLKISQRLWPVDYFWKKRFIIDIWLGSKYTSVLPNKRFLAFFSEIGIVPLHSCFSTQYTWYFFVVACNLFEICALPAFHIFISLYLNWLRDQSFSTNVKLSETLTFLTRLICTRTCAYQGVRNVSVSENFA